MTTTWKLIGRLTRKPSLHVGKKTWCEAVIDHAIVGSPSPIRVTGFHEVAERLAACDAGDLVEVTGTSAWSLVITDIRPVVDDE